MTTIGRAMLLRWTRSALTIAAGIFALLTLILARRLASSDRLSQLLSSPSTWRDLLMCLAASALLGGPLACIGVWLRMRKEGSLVTLLASAKAARALEQATLAAAALTATIVGIAVFGAESLQNMGARTFERSGADLQWKPWPEQPAIDVRSWMPESLHPAFRQSLSDTARTALHPLAAASLAALTALAASRFAATARESSMPRICMAFLNVAALCVALCAASPWVALTFVACVSALLETRFRRRGIWGLP